MWGFSESVNEYLEKKLVTKENETDFLFAFKRACENQIELTEDMSEGGNRYCSTVVVWKEKLPVSYDVIRDEDGILYTIDEDIILTR